MPSRDPGSLSILGESFSPQLPLPSAPRGSRSPQLPLSSALKGVLVPQGSLLPSQGLAALSASGDPNALST